MSEKYRDIILLGLKHSGKTAQGMRLARTWGGRFLDLDELVAGFIRRRHPECLPIEEINNESEHGLAMKLVRSFYRQYGKEAFQKLEAEAFADLERPVVANNESPDAASLGGAGPRVLALGGGAMENKALTDMKRPSGLWVFLDVPCEILYERIIKGGIPPFLDPLDPWNSFRTLYERRRMLAIQTSDVIVELGPLGLDRAGSVTEKKIQEFLDGRQ